MKVRLNGVLSGKAVPFGAAGQLSGIDKRVIEQRVRIESCGLVGDEQGDPKHHGGPEKALHHYAHEHYARWKSEWPAGAGGLQRFDNAGAFGENLTTDGMSETNVCIGDVYALGGSVVEVSQPRQPCWKLNLRFDRADMSRAVQTSRRTGWYYRVLQPGEVEAGDAFELLSRPNPDWTIDRLLFVMYMDRHNRTALAEMATLAGLSPGWQKTIRRRLESGQVESWSSRLDTPAFDC